MTRTILLVEDNASDEKLTLVALRRSGVPNEVVVVRDGAEAIDWLYATGRHAGRDPTIRPALVLLDLKLPRIDGFDVLRRIRSDERTRLLPVVVLTASREDEDVVRSYTLGANAHVRKSVDFAEFAETARTLGRFWLLLNELPNELLP
jgi:two-component system response regulator